VEEEEDSQFLGHYHLVDPVVGGLGMVHVLVEMRWQQIFRLPSVVSAVEMGPLQRTLPIRAQM
jgi:hypothetical protein